MAIQRICSVEGCGKVHLARGWCLTHYNRWKRSGDPLVIGKYQPGAAAEFFRNSVLQYNGSDCLIWPFGRTTAGYGVMYLKRVPKYVHIRVCEHFLGAQPSSAHVSRHLCGKGHLGCCAKNHIVWGTQADNMADARRHGTVRRGGDCATAKLTESDVRQIRALREKLSHEKIAKRFGVSRKAISKILSGQTWGWLK